MDFNKTLSLIMEAEKQWVKGSRLSPEQQREAKSKFVHRFTGNNKPEWTKQIWKDGKTYPLHFKDDKDWLENTEFAVKKNGELCGKTKYCNSKPTYPNNPELRKKDMKEAMDLSEASNNSIKDIIDKAINGDTISASERSKLVRLGFLDNKGNITSKAEEEYSELFD
jgi:hypothetical protein